MNLSKSVALTSIRQPSISLVTATTFDTSKFARDLRDKAKLTTEQAEGFADAISGVFHDEVATRTETLDLRSAVREDVQNVRSSVRESSCASRPRSKR